MLFDKWFRPTPRQYVAITRGTLVALSTIIVTGAAVRLTGSGLGCSDWPTCEQDKFVAELEFHPMIEFVNRLITGCVSVAVILAVLGSLRRRPRRADLTRWSIALVAGVVAQIVIGAFVTLSELKYSVVALHFLVSMVLVWASVVLMDLSERSELDEPDRPASSPTRRWPLLTKALVGWGTAVLIAGSMVTSAGPHPGSRTTGGQKPEMIHRFPIDVGSVTRIHSILVWCLCATVIAIAVLIARHPADWPPGAQRRSHVMLVAVVAQGAIGYIQYFTDVPALLAGVHVAGATLVWILVLRFALASATTKDVIPT